MRLSQPSPGPAARINNRAPSPLTRPCRPATRPVGLLPKLPPRRPTVNGCPIRCACGPPTCPGAARPPGNARVSPTSKLIPRSMPFHHAADLHHPPCGPTDEALRSGLPPQTAATPNFHPSVGGAASILPFAPTKPSMIGRSGRSSTWPLSTRRFRVFAISAIAAVLRASSAPAQT